jgi:hypothetical protein
MFKKLKGLINNLHYLPDIMNRLHDIGNTVDNLEKTDPFNGLNVPIVEHELSATKDAYEEALYEQAIISLHKYRYDFQEAVKLYDKILYQSTDKLTKGNYVTVLLTTLAKLRVLKEFILEMLFHETDVFSFYLYFTDNDILKGVLRELPLVDIGKAFISNRISADDENTIHEDRFAEICMTRTSITIHSPVSVFEIDNALRKTIVRVLYSIYTNKYHLYHLSVKGSESRWYE